MRPSSAGETGEFCTRGYSVMLGYWDDEEKTDEAIDADGWMHTGDLAEMREDGYCNIVGRIKDMVIRGGENIYPREIEEFLYTHPDIADVQVIGVPDERYGEELCAWVEMKPGAEPLDADEVRAFATGKLAHYKIPRYVMVVEDFPMTVTGKIRKVEMREQSAKQLGLDRRRSTGDRHDRDAGRRVLGGVPRRQPDRGAPAAALPASRAVRGRLPGGRGPRDRRRSATSPPGRGAGRGVAGRPAADHPRRAGRRTRPRGPTCSRRGWPSSRRPDLRRQASMPI